MPAHFLYKVSETPSENAVDTVGTAVRQESRKSDLNVSRQYRNSALSPANPNTERVRGIRSRSSHAFANRFSRVGKAIQIFFKVSDVTFISFQEKRPRRVVFLSSNPIFLCTEEERISAFFTVPKFPIPHTHGEPPPARQHKRHHLAPSFAVPDSSP